MKPSRLILPPGVQSTAAVAVAGALGEIIKPPTFPRIQRIAGAPHKYPEGTGMLIRLYVQTSPIAGTVLEFGAPTNAPITTLAKLLRETADKLDEIAANAQTKESHQDEPGSPGSATAPTSGPA